MADRLAPGEPYRVLQLGNGVTAPFYVVPFDKHGICTGPLTAQRFVNQATSEQPTDVFLFSHGWNDDWAHAMRLYDNFVDGFAALRAKHPLAAAFRPMLAGIFWPSIALVAPGEREPDIAGGDAPDDEAIAAERAEIDEVAPFVPAAQRERFYALAQRESDLDEAEQLEFATLIAGAFAGSDELRTVAEVPPDEVLAMWRAVPASDQKPVGDDFGFANEGVAAPQAAGFFSALDPRNLVRIATVLLMKDRSGRVGAHGVADLLESVLAAGEARVHLVGHSYGCKVVLSALAAKPHSRNVESVLLLQPAMSHLCFAADADGDGHQGGYRPALTRTNQPIMATFSRHDIPLTKLFHLAARRKSDIGDMQIAGAPSRYAALGGFGPGGIDGEAVVVPAVLPEQKYAAQPVGIRVVAVESSDFIAGHGDITNDATEWMLLNQIATEA
jgi:hypothetical protein